MVYQILAEKRPTQGIDGTVFTLLEADTGCAAEIWPALGFNCIRWQMNWKGKTLDLLYADPQLYQDASPTRSGIPILFPFPNRIRAGRFAWQGRDYQLPLNDPAHKNAIHGFACRSVWRVVDQGTDRSSAWLTGEFCASVDAPEACASWPADHRLRVTYRLTNAGLGIEAVVTNPDKVPLPFGLGYHPYFRVPFVDGATEEDCWVDCPARHCWELEENVPTGKRHPLDETCDLTTGRWFPHLRLDDALTDLGSRPPSTARRCWCGQLRDAKHRLAVQLLAAPAFRELVVFTPPHRQAFCLEPYTCTTDAINLHQRGFDAGLLILEPGAEWRGVVELRLVEVSAPGAAGERDTRAPL